MATVNEWDDETAAKDKEQSEQGTGGQFLEALPEGDTVLRFLPPIGQRKSPFATAYVHWITLPTGERRKVNCPRMMAKQPCEVCAKAEKLRASRNPADQKAGKKLFPKMSVYANVIDRGAEHNGVQVYGFGKTVFEGLVAIRQNPKKGGKFVGVEDGRDIIITRKGKGQFDTEYSVAADMSVSPLHMDPGQADEWLEAAPDLDQFLVVLTPEDFRAKIRGEDSGESARPARGAARGQSVSDDAATFNPDEFEKNDLTPH